MNFNKEQLEAVYSEKPLVVVSAGAGSGKTRVLTERFVYLCEQRFKHGVLGIGASVQEIVAITFTEKAAREMKERIRKRIREKANEAQEHKEKQYWAEQIEAVDQANISTFHSFCQRLLSQYAMLAQLPPTLTILDESKSRQLTRETLLQLIREVGFVERLSRFFAI